MLKERQGTNLGFLHITEIKIGHVNKEFVFRPGIAFTICTNQVYLPKNDSEGLKLILKMAFKKRNTNFRLEHSVRKNRSTFPDVPLLLERFRWKDPKYCTPFNFQPDFPETLLCK